jgi:HEPN domain-containing protein
MGNQVDELQRSPADQFDNEAASNTFNQMFELFFGPEIERRKQAGALPNDFFLYMAQVLFPTEGVSTIHLNDEVKGVGSMRANRPVQAGDPISVEDLGRIEKFDLPDDLLDSGHFTIIRSSDRWLMFFNFLSGRKKARDRLRLASEFVDAARESARKGHAGPSIDTLFSAAELAAKAELILHRSEASKAKTHGPVASAINKWSQLGNIDRAFVELFNRLAEQRPNARYADSGHRPPLPTQDEFELINAVIEKILRRAGRTTEDP